MDRDKQIFEMAMLMTEGARPSVDDAEALYNAGYRKASDVAREIFEEIERLIELYTENSPILIPFNYIDVQFVHWLAELKKKYTEGEQ